MLFLKYIRRQKVKKTKDLCLIGLIGIESHSLLGQGQRVQYIIPINYIRINQSLVLFTQFSHRSYYTGKLGRSERIKNVR